MGLVVAVLAIRAGAGAPTEPKAWHRLIGILQYLEADYPAAVASQDAFEVDEQRAFISEALVAAQELGPAGEPFVARLESVRARVEQLSDPEGVSRDCGALVNELVLAGGLSRSPRHRPDLERGRAVYLESCAACHGAAGDGKVDIASTMTPPPTDFLDPEGMGGLSAYKAFNTVTFGLSGTAMPSYVTLDEEDRWAVAFFLFTLRQPPCEGEAPKASLEQLATATDSELAARFGESQLACLRRQPPEVDAEQSLLAARHGVEEAMVLASAGKYVAARQAIVDAYLNGIEPIEPVFRSRDPALVRELEEAFGRVRLEAERKGPHLAQEGRALLAVIDRARSSGGAPVSFWFVFAEAFAILLREGFEAMVVVAALLAMLKKVEAPRAQARLVHLGWLSALAVGGLGFAFGRSLLAAADREWMEAVVGFAAVALLVYAALWLNARANVRKLMGELRERMQGALGRGSALGLFAISFTAVLRESVETAVFLQGLAVDSASATAYGALAGLAALVGLVLFVDRVGFRLPMKALFNASTVLLMGTAVVMLGKALHALQEVGQLPLWPVPFPRAEVLGVFPDGFTLIPQAALALAPVLWLLWRRQRGASGGLTLTPVGRSRR